MTPVAQNIKLRRELRELRATTADLLKQKLDSENYLRWADEVNRKIKEININISTTRVHQRSRPNDSKNAD